MEARIDTLTKQLFVFADIHDYDRTRRAMRYLRNVQMEAEITPRLQEYLQHGLSAAWLLVELRAPVTDDELDLMLSATVLHVLVERYGADGLQGTGADERVKALVQKMIKADENPGIVLSDKLLLLAKMVERSSLMEQLCDYPPEEGKMLLKQAKQAWISLCLEAELQYPELEAALSAVREKMRAIVLILDVLYKRYDEEEDALYEEILDLTEENARIRAALEKHQTTL